jgi:TPR repeat protein
MNLFIHFIKNFIRIISFNYFFYETLDDKIKHENFVKYAKKEDSEALFELSKLYLNTESFDFNDLSFGIYILKKSFELGHQESGTKLSNIYLHIYSKTKNIDFFNTALNMNLTLAKDGNVEANLFLGFYYENNSEYKKSLSYFKAAAKQNNPSALLALAFMYKDGKGVDIDNDKYLYLLKKSAENNLDDAQYLLGKIYLEKGQISSIYELLINEDKDKNNYTYNFNCAKNGLKKQLNRNMLARPIY